MQSLHSLGGMCDRPKTWDCLWRKAIGLRNAGSGWRLCPHHHRSHSIGRAHRWTTCSGRCPVRKWARTFLWEWRLCWSPSARYLTCWPLLQNLFCSPSTTPLSTRFACCQYAGSLPIGCCGYPSLHFSLKGPRCWQAGMRSAFETSSLLQFGVREEFLRSSRGLASSVISPHSLMLMAKNVLDLPLTSTDTLPSTPDGPMTFPLTQQDYSSWTCSPKFQDVRIESH